MITKSTVALLYGVPVYTFNEAPVDVPEWEYHHAPYKVITAYDRIRHKERFGVRIINEEWAFTTPYFIDDYLL